MSGKTFWLQSDGRPTRIEINRIMKDHRIAIQQAMAISLNNARIRAHDYIISNRAFGRTGLIRNPRGASKVQPATPGKLTSRTGKLKYMLKHSISPNNPLRSWKGWGKINAKQKSIAFLSQVNSKRTGRDTDVYVGTIRVNITMNSILADLHGGRPRESLRTLAVRFNWETGIRGESRAFFKPTSKATDFDMRRLVNLKDAKIRRVI